MKTFIAVTLFICLMNFALGAASINHMTARVQEKGHAYICGTYFSFEANKFWNAKGKECEAYNEFNRYEYNLYTEYGITQKDTFSIEGGWARIEESLNGRTFGIEDLRISLRHCLGMKRSYLISLEVEAIIPTERRHKPALRYGQYGGGIGLLLTKDFLLFKRNGNFDFKIGYLKYDGFPSDQLEANAVINFFPFSKFILSAGAFLEYGLFNGHAKNDESFFLFRSNYRLLRGEIQAAFLIYKGASLFVGYRQHLFGRNIGINGGAYGGAQIQF